MASGPGSTGCRLRKNGPLDGHVEDDRTPQRDQAVLADERLDDALALAYRYLNRRERTAAETLAHLTGKGVDEETAHGAVRALAEHGYLDDARYATMFVQDKRELDRWGSERIRRALLGRGIQHDLVEAALAAGDGELERAVAVLRKRFTRPLEGQRERERALGVLVRKGYDWDLALEALTSYARGSP